MPNRSHRGYRKTEPDRFSPFQQTTAYDGAYSLVTALGLLSLSAPEIARTYANRRDWLSAITDDLDRVQIELLAGKAKAGRLTEEQFSV
jgi:hypothetical protein